MFLIAAFIGLLMITMGRQIYWLFVGGIGFIFGIILATQYYSGESDWVMIFIALLAGVAGALFAYSLDTVALIVAGLLTGGYLAYVLLLTLGFETDLIFRILIIVGGNIGLLLVLYNKDWALIILSSMGGATLFVQSTGYSQTVSLILFISLSILGVIIQTVRWRQEPKHL